MKTVIVTPRLPVYEQDKLCRKVCPDPYAIWLTVERSVAAVFNDPEAQQLLFEDLEEACATDDPLRRIIFVEPINGVGVKRSVEYLRDAAACIRNSSRWQNLAVELRLHDLERNTIQSIESTTRATEYQELADQQYTRMCLH